MEIRPFENADEDAVVALWERAGLLVPHNDPRKDIAFCRTSGHGALFVGVEDGVPIAVVMVGHDGHRGWIYYLAVDPACQRKGHGRAMLGHAEVWLRGQGVPKVELMIREGNAKVRGFYDAAGYRAEPVIVMSRWLTERGDA